MRITKEMLQKENLQLHKSLQDTLAQNKVLLDKINLIEKYTQPFYEKTLGQNSAIRALVEALINRRLG